MSGLEIVSIGLAAASTFFVSHCLLKIAVQRRDDLSTLTSQNRNRIERLRRRSMIYRVFEPSLEKLGRHFFVRLIVRAGTIDASIKAGTGSLPFQATELVAVMFIRSVVIAMIVLAILLLKFSWVPAIFLSLCVLVAFPNLSATRLKALTARHTSSIARRLPFATDLLAMQLNAGLPFRQALGMIAEELSGHELGDALKRVIRLTDQGVAMEDALQSMSDRIPNSDVADFVVAIQSSRRRGNPMAQTLTNLAEQMRVRRTERAEKAAGRAQANITFPGLLIMGACLLILLAPFVLQAIQENPFGF